MDESDIDRRTVMEGGIAGVAVATGLAGCTGGASSDGDGTDSGGDNGTNASATNGGENDSSAGENDTAGGNRNNGSGDRTMRVVLEEWRVKPDSTSIPAGSVTFTAVNRGHEVHELVVRQRTDDGAYEELDEVDDIAKGESKQLSMELTAGTYELACLIVEEEDAETEDHYRLGMHETIEVTKQG